MAASAVYGGTVSWFAENNKDACKVLAHHWPQIPNLGDVTEVDWDSVPKVDILAAGFPCQNISNAGDRKGITGDKSRLWEYAIRAVRSIRPRIVILENVAAIRTRGFDVVASDLATLGYDTVWTCVRASDVGAPHRRDRWFCAAYAATQDAHGPTRDQWGSATSAETESWRPRADAGGRSGVPAEPADDVRLLPTPVARDGKGAGYAGQLPNAVALLPTPKATDGTNGGPNQRDASGRYYLPGVAVRLLPTPTAAAHGGAPGNGHQSGADLGAVVRLPSIEWREYAPAIRRWESITGVPAPEPTEPAPRGGRRLSPALPEWMMGLPPGHVTGVAGISRNGQLRVIGGGVVPRQAVAALHWMADQWAAVETLAA